MAKREPIKRLTLTLSDGMAENLDIVARCYNVTPQDAVRMLIRREGMLVRELAEEVTHAMIDRYDERQVMHMAKGKKTKKGGKGC